MEEGSEQPEAPEGSFGGFLFLLVISLTLITGVAQLVIVKEYIALGFLIIMVAGLTTAFLVRAGHSPRAGENTEDKK